MMLLLLMMIIMTTMMVMVFMIMMITSIIDDAYAGDNVSGNRMHTTSTTYNQDRILVRRDFIRRLYK